VKGLDAIKSPALLNDAPLEIAFPLAAALGKFENPGAVVAPGAPNGALGATAVGAIELAVGAPRFAPVLVTEFDMSEIEAVGLNGPG
jgi:hypothetical protein